VDAPGNDGNVSMPEQFMEEDDNDDDDYYYYYFMHNGSLKILRSSCV